MPVLSYSKTQIVMDSRLFFRVLQIFAAFRFARPELLDACTTTLHIPPQSLRPQRFTATHLSSPKNIRSIYFNFNVLYSKMKTRLQRQLVIEESFFSLRDRFQS